MCVAAVMAARRDEDDGVAASSGRDVSLPVLIAGMVALLGLLAVEAAQDSVLLGTVIVTMIGMTIMTARLVLLGREHDVMTRTLQGSLNEQERLASTDPMTGLHTRRFFEEILKIEVKRAVHAHRNVSLIVIDLDGFRRVNDECGYLAGDEALREIAGRLLSVARSIDVLASYSGEEFVAVLPETNSNVARAVVDRALRTARMMGPGNTHVGTGFDFAEVGKLVSESSALTFMQDLADEIDGQQTTDSHSIAMAAFTGLIAEELNLSPEDRWTCVAASRLHDVGKVGVPDSILTKPGPLNDEEWDIVRQHPRHGARIVALSQEFGHVAPIIEDHHERWDGAGYPNGKAGEEIELGARIIAVCDSWTAMRANRPYRKDFSQEHARRELEECAGSQFDPQIVEIFLQLEASGVLHQFDESDGSVDAEAA